MPSSSDTEREAFLSGRRTPSSRSASSSSRDHLLDHSRDHDHGHDHDHDHDDLDTAAGPGDGLLREYKIQPPGSNRRRWCGVLRRAAGISPNRRSRSRGFLLAVKFTSIFLFCLLVLTPILAPSYIRLPTHYDELADQCEARLHTGRPGDPSRTNGCANPRGEKVFISVSLYDKDGHLAGGDWGRAVLELVHLLGPDNVFLSIYENDSGPLGGEALAHLKSRLPCAHSVVYEEHVPVDIFPNVTLADGSLRTKRLAYLSEMRNRALRPLDTLAGVNAVQFDKVLFLNDVAFRPMDAAHLLFNTNVDAAGRAQYLSVCALDWKHPAFFYDVFAQRDAEGFSNGLPFFPVFTTAGGGQSRAAMLSQSDAVPVQACWGGMVAMQAAYVQNLNASLPRPDFQDIGSHVIDPAQPTRVAAPIRFRYEPEVYFDACECCLFLADVSQVARSAGRPETETGVFVNPYVRVAYGWRTLRIARIAQRWERLFVLPQTLISKLASLPRNNPHRLVKEGEPFVEEVWNSTSRAWDLEPRVGRSGMFCGVRKALLLKQGPRTGDRNWKNERIPPGQTLHFPE